MDHEVPTEVANHIATLEQRIALLEMQVQCRDEIIATYRDALQALQVNQQLAGALSAADLKALQGAQR